MIDEIRLVKFGKFTNKNFKFSQATVFFGENEAGKTTIFDALLTGLCKISKTTKLVKEIYQRYGDDCSAVIRYTDPEFAKYDFNEFINLFAIRSGEINFSMSEGDWIERVKANLFSGGIDPKQLIDKFAKMSSDDKKVIHNKELIESLKQKTLFDEKLKKLNDERSAILDREKINNKFKNDLAILKDEIIKMNDLKDQTEHDILFQEKINERKRFKSILNDLYKKIELDGRINLLANLNNGDVKHIREKEDELNQIKIKFNNANDRILNLQTNINSQNEKKNERAFAKTITLDDISLFINQIVNYRNNPYIKDKLFFKISYLIIGFIISIALGISAFMLSQNWIYFISLLIIIITFFFSKGTSREKDNDKENIFIKKIKDDFRNRTQTTLHSETLDGLNEELINLKNDIDNMRKWHDEKDSEIISIRNEIDKIDLLKKEYEVKIIDLKNEISNWYRNKGVAGFDEYVNKKNQYLDLKNKLDDINIKIENYINDFKINDFFQLKTECERKLKLLDDECIPDTGIKETDFNFLKLKLKKINEELTIKNNKREGLEKNIIGYTENIKASLGDIPDDIIEIQEKLERLKKTIKEIETEKKASGILKNIFEEIASDSNRILNELSIDLKNQFAMILSELRDVTITNLDENSISINDAAGELRNINMLSRGTKESFLFASRLLFALKSSTREKNIIILDEPFHSFDENREKKSLEILKFFMDTYEYQIILLTKEKRIVEESKNIFKEKLIVYNL